MGVWGRELKVILRQEKNMLWLGVAYVDDVRLVTPVIGQTATTQTLPQPRLTTTQTATTQTVTQP